MDAINDGQYQEELSNASSQLEQLTFQLKLKERQLEKSQLTLSQSEQKLALLAQENKKLQFKVTQLTQENNKLAIKVEKSLNKPQKPYQKLQNNEESEISSLKEKNIQRLQSKISQLQEQLNIQRNVAIKNEQKFKEKQQEMSHLVIVLNQVQQEYKNAKKFRDKTFEEEYNKLLKQCQKFQTKLRKLKEENGFLKQEKTRLQERAPLNMYGQSICTISQHSELGMRIKDAEKYLDQYKKRQDNWIKERVKLETRIKFKSEEINSLNWRFYELQESLTKPITPTLTPTYGQLYPYQEAKKTPTKEDMFTPQPISKPLLQTPWLSPVQYVKEIARKLNVSWQGIYYELDGLYILDHSNVAIDIDKFLKYDWSKLKQANFYNTGFDFQKWIKMMDHAKEFPVLEMVYMHGNPLTFVKQEELYKFKRLKSIFFNYTDETRGCKNSVYPVYRTKKL